MRYLSLCSGIEAATVAWHPLGWRAVAFSEIDKFPSAVLAHHYPDVPNWGDMTKFQEWPDAAIDLLVGGTPCQSFSVAGLRKGLDDPRGNLMLTYLAIAAKYRPRWVVWENVPGVLSSGGGRDFGTFLGALGELGYGWAYRILDAQYFGVAQRRRRVFVVGYLGDWHRAAAVLFGRHSLSGHPAPRREAGERVANALTDRADRGGTNSEGQRLIAAPHSEISPALKARDSKGVSSDGDGDGDGAILVPMVSPTLRAGGNKTGGDRPPGTDVDTVETLIPLAIQAGALRENPDAGPDGVGVQDSIAYTLEARSEVQAVAYRTAGDGAAFEEGDVTAPLTTATDRSANVGGQVAVAFDMAQITSKTNGSRAENGLPTGTLSKGSDMHVATAMQVRRLTPTECERLQGFPDGYTLIPVRGKPAADGPRYKALGNSMAVPVMAWIGRRIAEVDAIAAQDKAA